MSERFIQYLARGVQHGRSANPLELADCIAHAHGFERFEQLMKAAERDELSPEQEERLLEDLRPLVEWALEHRESETSDLPHDQLAAIKALIGAIIHFLFGYTLEELETLQVRWGVEQLIQRVHQAELARESRRAASESSDPEAPASLMRSLL